MHGEEVVVTASRAETSLVNAPATMTVVTSEQIANSPAQNFGDLLRNVPGLNVIQMSARDINIDEPPGHVARLSNSQLALLDGRSIYLDFFGLMLWDFVPTNPEDIKQIEVVRGPASAVWGANALTGVINIITKSPRECRGHDAHPHRRHLQAATPDRRRATDAGTLVRGRTSATRARPTTPGPTGCPPATSTPTPTRGRSGSCRGTSRATPAPRSAIRWTRPS